MSHSEAWAIFPGDRVECIAEFANSWGTAPAIWRPLTKRYVALGRYEHWLQSLDRLWPLADDERLPLHHRAALALTFDRWYVARAHYARLALDLTGFFSDFPVPPEHVNHWPAIISILESEPGYPSIGFMWTSVSNNPWLPSYGADDEPIPLDWGKVVSLYDALEAPDA